MQAWQVVWLFGCLGSADWDLLARKLAGLVDKLWALLKDCNHRFLQDWRLEASRLQIASLAGYLAGWLGSADQRVSGVGGEAVGPSERLQSSIPAGYTPYISRSACSPGVLEAWGRLADYWTGV